MFGNNKTTTNTTTASNDNFSANTIQNGTEIEGDIVSKGSIRIDGKLKGTLRTNAKLVIGKTGVIIGEIHCQNASIEGQVNGEFNIQGLLDIRSTGTVEGNIVYSKLVVEEGAKLLGNCSLTNSTQKASISGKENFNHKKAV